MAQRKQLEKIKFETDDEEFYWVDDIYIAQKKYFKTDKGKMALKKARKSYDDRDKDKRRKQKRDYMRRKRDKDPRVWR